MKASQGLVKRTDHHVVGVFNVANARRSESLGVELVVQFAQRISNSDDLLALRRNPFAPYFVISWGGHGPEQFLIIVDKVQQVLGNLYFLC